MSHVRNSATRRPGWWPILVLLLWPAAAAMAQVPADHLLLSEVVVKTRSPVSTFGSPFIEVHNPTDTDVDLTDVYLSTAHDTNPVPNMLYWNVVGGENAGGGTSGNVHGRFPAGMTLAFGDTLTISLSGSDEFEEAYGYLPDLEWFEDGLAPMRCPRWWRSSLAPSVRGSAPATATIRD